MTLTSDWQPIDTARKDSTHILGYKAGPFTGNQVIMYWDWATGKWVVFGSREKMNIAPTHWQHLPQPPKEL